MSQYSLKLYRSFEGNVKVELDFSSYATKRELKNATGVDTSKLAEKFDLASLKGDFDKNKHRQIKTVPVDLSKLSNVVKNQVVKKTVYYKLVAKVNRIDNSGFDLKTKYQTDKSDLVKETPDTSGLVKNKEIIVLKLVN